MVVLFRRQFPTDGYPNGPDWTNLCPVHGSSDSTRRIGGMGGVELEINTGSPLLTRKVLFTWSGTCRGNRTVVFVRLVKYLLQKNQEKKYGKIEEA